MIRIAAAPGDRQQDAENTEQLGAGEQAEDRAV